MVKIKSEEIANLLVEAKRNTYAKKGEGAEIFLPNKGKKLEFKKGEFFYRDIYFGFNPFIGEEVVWYKNKIAWGMNYYGKIILNDVPPGEIYEFLKESLRKVEKGKPFRGLDGFEKKNFKYLNRAKGSLDNFIGKERILFNNKEVYNLVYHGGFVEEK